MNYTDLNQAREDSNGLLHIEDNFGGGIALSEAKHLIFSPHGVRAISNESDFVFDPEAAPQQFRHLRELLRSDLGPQIAKFSEYQADGGANEIGRAIMAELAEKGEGAIMISPALIGRGILDLNRTRKAAIGDNLFVVPRVAKEDLEKIYDICQDIVSSLLRTVNLTSLIQAHTMGSANCTETEKAQLTDAATELRRVEEDNNSPFYKNPQIAKQLIDVWGSVSANMNAGRNRPAIDIITGVKTTQESSRFESFMDRETGARFADQLRIQKTPSTFNDPYSFIVNIPGTNLANSAASRGAKQLNFDVPRHLLLRDPNESYGILTFQPDRQKVREIALAIVNSL